MLPEKYPKVLDIKVFEGYDGYGIDNHFRIYLGVKYADLEEMDSSEVRDYVKEISKYVLKGNESLQIVFFDPNS
jgi:hypothetical protein